MTYDLRRLRLNGLIRRLPHTNRYTLTEDGIRIAVFYTKIYNRLLVPLTAANQPQAPPSLRAALAASPATSTTTPPAPACPAPPENLTQTSTTSRPKIATPIRRLRSESVAPPGQHNTAIRHSRPPSPERWTSSAGRALWSQVGTRHLRRPPS